MSVILWSFKISFVFIFLIKIKALGIKVNVVTKAKSIPTDIIFPNSITGFNSPESKDMKAIPVVNAAKKHGAMICLNVSFNLSFFEEITSINSLNLTRT